MIIINDFNLVVFSLLVCFLRLILVFLYIKLENWWLIFLIFVNEYIIFLWLFMLVFRMWMMCWKLFLMMRDMLCGVYGV